MLDGTYYVECACTSDEHTLRFTLDAEEEGIYTSVYLNTYRQWYKRVWVAIKYIFGYHCIHGHWDCTLIDRDNIHQLKTVIQKFDELIAAKK